MTRPTITVAIIALDEANQLTELARSLTWADEVLLVDGGSRDATCQVARELGWRVAHRTFDNFAAQRNAALELARSEWVLFVDTDERPTPRLVEEIRNQLRYARRVAYRVPIRSSIFGRPFRFSGTQDDRPTRLVCRGRARWQGDVHETLVADGPVGELTHSLQHNTLPDLHSFLAKMNRYTTLEAKARVARGVAPRRRDAYVKPVYEFLRRLIWKQGWLDGPAGWTFCLLSGVSEWVLARTHWQLWHERFTVADDTRVVGPHRIDLDHAMAPPAGKTRRTLLPNASTYALVATAHDDADARDDDVAMSHAITGGRPR